MKKNLITPLAAICLLMFSCKKSPKANDDDNTDPEPATNQSCYISSWVDGDVLVQYLYDGDNSIITENITKVPGVYEAPKKREFDYRYDRIIVTESTPNKTYDLLLTSNRITEIPERYFRHSIITYSPEGYITLISTYDNKNKLAYTRDFKYQSGNLTSIVATFLIGEPYESVEIFTLEYYTGKKAIDGVDLSLNQFILPDWAILEYFAPFQLPTTFFGKPSANLLKKIIYPNGRGYYNFSYDFDKNDKVNKITYSDQKNKTKTVSLQYQCK
jgi:hypothetical protein